MKKYVRAVLDDLNLKAGKTQNAAVLTQEVNNQTLSTDPQQKVRQLDFQVQQDQERETLS